jgi:hypothetical protein
MPDHVFVNISLDLIRDLSIVRSMGDSDDSKWSTQRLDKEPLFLD